MPIENITTDELRKMSDKEALILQGCGGDLQEWIDGVNEMLTESGILLNGTKFEKVYAFQNDNLTNLLYPFEDVELSIGKLAMWRIATHTQFYGIWLSDYVPNYLGGFVAKQKARLRVNRTGRQYIQSYGNCIKNTSPKRNGRRSHRNVQSYQGIRQL